MTTRVNKSACCGRIGQVIWLIALMSIFSIGVAQSAQPNVVLIYLDDATYDEIGHTSVSRYFPNIYKYLQSEGSRFTNFHTVAPLCGPARASLFRGQYPHNTGVLENKLGWNIFYDSGYTDSEIGMWMREAGYKTALVGKYCHEGYPAASENDRYVPPGWDEFYASVSARYYDVRINDNGNRYTHAAYPDGYRTDLEKIRGVRVIREHDFNAPLFMYMAPFAPHYPPKDPAYNPIGEAQYTGMVAQRHELLFESVRLPRVPSLNELDVSDKTPQYAALPMLSDAEIETEDKNYQLRLQSVAAVDDMVGAVVEELESRGQLDNTYVFLTSDNGFQQGHHRDFAKKDPFERTTRVELLVRGPGVPKNLQFDHLLGHIDLIPTILELGQAHVPHFVDGKSFVPLLKNPTGIEESDWRSAILIENTEPKNRNGRVLDQDYVALRRQDDIFVQWNNGGREYYDLRSDPHQLNNRYSSLSGALLEELQEQLDAMSGCGGANCYDSSAQGASHVVTTLNVANDQTLSSATVELSGQARGADSVSAVAIVVRRVSDGKYWNGSEFKPEYVPVDAALTQVSSTTANWHYQLKLPSIGQRYWVSARSTTVKGDSDPFAATAFFNIGLATDTELPTITLSQPQAGTAVSSPVTLAGSANDNDELVEVRVYVREEDTQAYFDGELYGAKYRLLNAKLVEKLDGSWSWELPGLELEDGEHRVTPIAIDAAGNKKWASGVITVGEDESIDQTLPQGTISNPGSEAVSNPVAFSGTAQDGESGLKSVFVVLRSTTTGKYWDGSSFVSSYANNHLPLSETENNVSWNYSGPAVLPEDEYYFAIRITDNAGNLRVISKYFTVKAAESNQPPVIGLGEPVSASHVTASSVNIRGNVVDEAGISSVQVLLQNRLNGKYWTGSNFQSQSVSLSTSLVQNSASVAFSRTLNDLPTGYYFMSVVAKNTSGKSSKLTRIFSHGPATGLEPFAYLNAYTNTSSSPYRLGGRAVDDDYVERVELVVQDSSSGLYWNGSIMQTGYVRVDASVMKKQPDSLWVRSIDNLPDGNYRAGIWAFDSAGNRTVASSTFLKIE